MNFQEFLGLAVIGLIIAAFGQFIYTVRTLSGLSRDIEWVKATLAARNTGMSHEEMVVRLETLERVVYANQTRSQAVWNPPRNPSSDPSGR
jgi:hypothetical protein